MLRKTLKRVEIKLKLAFVELRTNSLHCTCHEVITYKMKTYFNAGTRSNERSNTEKKMQCFKISLPQNLIHLDDELSDIYYIDLGESSDELTKKITNMTN